MIPLFKVGMSPDSVELASDVLRSGFIGQGERVEAFEARLRERLGSPHVNTVNSCTSGLQLALHMIRDLPGREILTTPLTCTATNTAIRAAGLPLRWVDIDPATGNIDPMDLARKIGPGTKAVMIVHWGGTPCDMTAIQRVCGEIPLIADCAHAFGATYNGYPIAQWADFSVFSFGPIKHLAAGDGGALVCADEDFHKRAKLLRWYGLDRESTTDFRCGQLIQEAGFKYHMSDVSAAIGLGNLRRVNTWLLRHQENGRYFDSHLAEIAGITTIPQDIEAESSYWVYTLRVERRDDFARALQSRGVTTSRVHDRNDKHPCFDQFRERLPQLDQFSREMICIPCGWWVGYEERDEILSAIKRGW